MFLSEFKKDITMNKKQKLAIASLISLTSLNAFSDDLSMTLYSDVFFGGNSVEFHGEIRVDEAYEPGDDSNREYYDHFAPVGVDRASSIRVEDRYCAIVASGEHFDGVWEMFGPGEYSSFLNINNAISSALTYKKFNSSCNPAVDLPVLYKDRNFSGRRYPLGFRKGHLTPEVQSGYWDSIAYDDADPNESGGYIASEDLRRIRNGGYVVSGGFSSMASSLTVPACYEVTLAGTYDYREYRTHTFGPGIYPDLRLFDMNDIVWSYDITRIPECNKPEVIIIPILM